MSCVTNPPFPSFTGLDGKPLEGGSIYIGTANLNPETDPITVYWDEALTQPAAQPIRTVAGYPSRNGSPAQIFTVAATYSITVRDNAGALVYSVKSTGGASLIGADDGASGTLWTTVQGAINWIKSAINWLVPSSDLDTGNKLFSGTNWYTSWVEGANSDVRYFGRKLTGTITAGPSADDRGYSGALLHVDARYDDADIGGDFVRVGMFRDVITGTSAKGGRLGVLGLVQQNVATNSANTNRNYVGVVGQAITYSGDGGTNTGAGAKGAFFGGNSLVAAGTGATNIYDFSSHEFDVENQAGTSFRYLTGISVVGMNAVQGTVADSAIRIGAGSDGGGTYGPGVGFKHGIMFTDLHGNDPVNSSSTLFGANWVLDPAIRTVAQGIDLSGFNITGSIIQGTKTFLSETQLTLGATGGGNSVIQAGNGSTDANLVAIAKGTGGVLMRDGSGVDRVLIDSIRGIRLVPMASSTPANNGELVVQATSNTSLTFKFKGSDGTVRSASLVLS